VKKENDPTDTKPAIHLQTIQVVEANPDAADISRLEIRVREASSSVGDRESANGGSPRDCQRERFVRWIVLVAVLAIAGLYTGFHIGKGWVPADDGTLAQSALRVMHGQLPNRDFAEIYTGGLSMLHALAFRVFGVNLMSLRICVFLFFLAWIPAVYSIALRFTSAVTAGVITLLAVVWSYPNYTAAMPSWYNLFFATFGAAALLRYLDRRMARWLFVAGVCGGVSILIKVIGAYYIAGVLLFLVFLEQSEAGIEEVDSERDRDEANTKNPAISYRIFSVGSLLLFLCVLLLVLRQRLGMSELYQFVLPSVTLVSLIFLGERGVRAASKQRFQKLFRLIGPFFGGFATPIIIFLIPYARSGAVSTFFRGVTSSAVSRASGLGVIRPLGAERLYYVLPLVAVIIAAMYWDKFQSQAIGVALGLTSLALVVRAAYSFDFVYGIWCSVVVLTPLTVLLGAILVGLRSKRDLRTTLERQQVLLLISLAATCSLVQFPFAAAIYLSYMVPLTLLALVAIVSTGKTQRGTYTLAAAMGLYLAFGVVSLVPKCIYEITWMVGPMQTMQSPRSGGLKIEEAVFFDDLARFLRDHSPNGLMFAGNDCPELYFLSGLKNVSPDDSGAPPEEILRIIQADDLNLVVINDAPYFPSATMRPDVKAEVIKRFPYTTRFGIFQIFWKR
jgi:hypothetical protein